MRLSSLLHVCSALWVVSLVALLGGVYSAQAQPLSSAPEMLEDAELVDIQFVDALHGWAVGDRGAIWKTEDAGRH